MNFRLFRFALGEAGASPWRAWPLTLGLILGVGSLVFLFGLAAQAEKLVRERLLGTLPDRVKVSATGVALGPVKMEGRLNQKTIEEIRSLSGVKEVFRQARFPEPCQLTANYGGERLVTDLVLEGVDPGQVASEVARGYKFEGGQNPAPAMVPRAILDVVNAGISVNTSLPNLTPSALTGRHFTLHLGTSSFNPGPSRPERCQIVGVSDQIGVGGPVVPIAQLEAWTDKPLQIHTLTVVVESPERLGAVVESIHGMGLKTPGLETARRLSGAMVFVRFTLVLFSLAILVTAGVGLSSGLALQVREESEFIGLYRAVGAQRSQILWLYLWRALALGLAGGLLGTTAGLVAGGLANLASAIYLPESFLGSEGVFAFSGAGVALGLAFCLLISFFSGLLPARRAAHMAPAEALRGL